MGVCVRVCDSDGSGGYVRSGCRFGVVGRCVVGAELWGISGGSFFFLEKEDDPRPLHLGDAYGHFIDYSRGPYKVLQQCV